MAAIVAAAVTMAADFPAEAAAEEADSPAAAEVSAAAVPAVNFNIESDVEKLVPDFVKMNSSAYVGTLEFIFAKVQSKPYIEDRLACYLL